MPTLAHLIEGTAIPLDLPPPAAAAGAQPLPLDIPHQEQDWWCWCAIAVGVSAFYEGGFGLSQCEAAARILRQPGACLAPDGPEVNVMHELDLALDEFRHFRAPVIQGPLKFGAVQAEIDAGRPVGVRIRFMDSGIGHFTVIRGYRAGALRMLAIDDPLYDESEVVYDHFVHRYRGTGVWRQTYLTQA